MQQNIYKVCADSLRAFSNDKFGINLKAAHAHELVAAFFGYTSKNALLADREHPISNLNQAEIVVMTPDDFIGQRRKKLQGLSLELPDNYTLGEAIYNSLFSDEWWASPYPPFRSFEKLAKFLVENNDGFQFAFRFYRNVPLHHIVSVKNAKDGVLITVFHSRRTVSGEMLGDGETTINLPRIAGYIGYGKPKVSTVRWTGLTRRTLKSKRVQS